MPMFMLSQGLSSVNSAGVGFATIQHLVRKGARVHLAARNETKACAAIERLKGSGLGQGEVRYLPLDLSDVTKAKASAEEFLKKEERLDILSKFPYRSKKMGLLTPTRFSQQCCSVSE